MARARLPMRKTLERAARRSSQRVSARRSRTRERSSVGISAVRTPRMPQGHPRMESDAAASVPALHRPRGERIGDRHGTSAGTSAYHNADEHQPWRHQDRYLGSACTLAPGEGAESRWSRASRVVGGGMRMVGGDVPVTASEAAAGVLRVRQRSGGYGDRAGDQ